MEPDMLEQEEESTLYEIKLDIFEGPMDLLLYLIRKDELDIYDIPIAHITTQYLGFLQQIHSLNIEQASDFILMAATLMRIKSQIMLPREELGFEGEGEEDPWGCQSLGSQVHLLGLLMSWALVVCRRR